MAFLKNKNIFYRICAVLILFVFVWILSSGRFPVAFGSSFQNDAYSWNDGTQYLWNDFGQDSYFWNDSDQYLWNDLSQTQNFPQDNYLWNDSDPPSQPPPQTPPPKLPPPPPNNPLPSVDIKANGSDGPITVPSGSPVNLTWVSQNATSCQASGSWSGFKPVSGLQTVLNVVSQSSFTIACQGPGGTASDSVTVFVEQNEQNKNLFVILQVNPSSGHAPLTGVDLTAQVSGTAAGSIVYRFDCANDGIFEKTITTASTSHTEFDLCDYNSPGIHSAKVRVERQGLMVEGVVNIIVDTTANLAVQFSSNPTSGQAPLNGVDLIVFVSGTATGAITYRFDCTNDGVFETVFTTNSTSHTAFDLCNYSLPGNYTAKVRVSRGGIEVEGVTLILVF